MKQYEIAIAPELANENFANFFNIYLRSDDILTYSINKGLYFENVDNLSPSTFSLYTIQEKDSWSTISFQFYDTIELWWLICKVNQITDPVADSPVPGTEIKLLNKDIVGTVLQQLRAT
jgi:hypothetical protein